MNVPFNRKRNIWFEYLVALVEVDHWNGIDKGWEPGALEHGKEICSSSKSNEVLKNQNSGKNEKNRKNEKAAKTRVSQLFLYFRFSGHLKWSEKSGKII